MLSSQLNDLVCYETLFSSNTVQPVPGLKFSITFYSNT